MDRKMEWTRQIFVENGLAETWRDKDIVGGREQTQAG